MATAFSWSDRLSAFSACLPCLRSSPSTASLSSPSQDQLRRLLADPESPSSLDAETLSLHSNPGVSGSRRRRQSKQRGFTLFGFHLFGRRTPAIQLSTDDTNDPLYANRRIRAPGPITSIPTANSATTFDSDAALLDPDTIDSISSRATAAAQAAEEERLQKEEKRKRRRERREIKKIAKALAVSASEGGEFEGFQGSGDGYPGIPSPFRPPSHSDTRSSSSHLSQEQQRSPVPAPTSLIPHLAMEEDEEDEGADLGGVVYTRRTVPPPSEGTKSLNRSSGSRSRTSTSLSDRSPYQYPQPPPDPKPMKTSTTPSSHKSRRNKSNSILSYSHHRHPSKSTATRSSTTTRSDSPSLASPTSPSYLHHPHSDTITNIASSVVSPSTIEQGQDFFDIGDDGDARFNDIEQAGNASSKKNGEGFPSTGFGINRGPGNGKSRDGAFLARTRDEELDHEFDGTF